jgi:hypothetical protein
VRDTVFLAFDIVGCFELYLVHSLDSV